MVVIVVLLTLLCFLVGANTYISYRSMTMAEQVEKKYKDDLKKLTERVQELENRNAGINELVKTIAGITKKNERSYSGRMSNVH
jgi:cell division protein FtsB